MATEESLSECHPTGSSACLTPTVDCPSDQSPPILVVDQRAQPTGGQSVLEELLEVKGEVASKVLPEE